MTTGFLNQLSNKINIKLISKKNLSIFSSTALKQSIWIVFILAFVLRIYRLGYYNLWRDEGYTWNTINRSIPEIIQSSKGDIHPPLYPILTHFWTNVFGQSEIGLRSLSVVFGMLTVLGVYLIAKKLFSSQSSIVLAVLLASTNPMLLVYSQEARSYSLMTFIVTGLLFCAFATNTTKKIWPTFLFWTFAVLGLYAHSLFVIILAALFIYQLLVIFHNNRFSHQSIDQKAFSNIRSLLFLYSLIFTAYTPWVYVLMNQVKLADGGFWLVFNPIKDLLRNTGNFFTSENYNNDLPFFSPIYKYYIEYFGLIMVFCGVIFEIKNKILSRSTALLTFLFLLIAYLVSFRSPVYYIRYLIFAVPTILLLFVRGRLTLQSIIGKKMTFSFIALFVVFSILFFITNIKENVHRGSFGEVATYLHNQKADLIIHPVSMSSWDSFKYYNQKLNLGLNSLVYSPERKDPSYMKAVIAENEYYNLGPLIQSKNFWSVVGWSDQEFDLRITSQGFCPKSKVSFEEEIQIVNWIKC
jgi:uncharacterized membrane protein